MRRARTCRWLRMRPYRVLLRGQGVFFAARSSADCITSMAGFDLRQAHPLFAIGIVGIRALGLFTWVVEKTQWALKDGDQHPLKAVGLVAAVVVFAIGCAWRIISGMV